MFCPLDILLFIVNQEKFMVGNAETFCHEMINCPLRLDDAFLATEDPRVKKIVIAFKMEFSRRCFGICHQPNRITLSSERANQIMDSGFFFINRPQGVFPERGLDSRAPHLFRKSAEKKFFIDQPPLKVIHARTEMGGKIFLRAMETLRQQLQEAGRGVFTKDTAPVEGNGFDGRSFCSFRHGTIQRLSPLPDRCTYPRHYSDINRNGTGLLSHIVVGSRVNHLLRHK